MRISTPQPGRLDFVPCSESALDPVHAFAFDAAHLDAASRQALGLESDNSESATDRLPLVVEFRITTSRGTR